MTKIFNPIRRLIRNRAGNVAVLTALSALPLIGIVGLAVDYAVALSNKSKLDAAADAAAIAAITTAQATILANSGLTGTALTDGQTQGQKVFKADAGAINFSASLPVPTITVTRPPGTQTLSATVKYTATNSNNFGTLFGHATAQLQGNVSSSLSLPKYINIYVVVDTSQSMGIAATPGDMAKLFSLTNCVFGCHVGPNSYESIAHDPNNAVTLRIDVIKSAVLQMLSQAQAMSSKSTVNIGLYTMELGLSTLTTPTNNYDNLKKLASNIDLSPDDGNSNNADSYSAASLSALAASMVSSGDGSTATNAQNYVFIMTDGTYDMFDGSCHYNHCVGPFDGSWSSVVQLKQKSTAVGVIYTTYNPIYQNNDPYQGLETNYGLLIAPISGNILKGLQGCATSPQWFIQANSSSDISTALNTFLMQSLDSARLVN